MKNYYRILDIPPNADQMEIEKAYQKLKNLVLKNSISLYSILPSTEKETFLKEIDEAYNTLINPIKRRNYDISIKTEQQKDEKIESEPSKQLSFEFAKGAFTYIDSTRKPEEAFKYSTLQTARDPYSSMAENVLRGADIETSKSDKNELTTQEQIITHKQSYTSFDIDYWLDTKDVAIEERKRENTDKIEQPKDVEIGGIKQKLENKLPEPIGQDNNNIEVKKEEMPTANYNQIIIDENTEFSGELLRRIRESMGITIKDIAKTTKISTANITYLEEENYNNLPALVYIKGYLTQIAKCLNLRPDLVVRSYLARMNERSEKKGK